MTTAPSPVAIVSRMPCFRQLMPITKIFSPCRDGSWRTESEGPGAPELPEINISGFSILKKRPEPLALFQFHLADPDEAEGGV